MTLCVITQIPRFLNGVSDPVVLQETMESGRIFLESCSA